MIPITRVLTAEHRMLTNLFDHIEAALPGIKRLTELRELGRLLEYLLRAHAGAEEDLLLVALDHLPQLKPRCNKVYEEHHEIDSRLTKLYQTRDLANARSLLMAAMNASRKHFLHEERVVFPLIEREEKQATLAKLGAIWIRRRHITTNWSH